MRASELEYDWNEMEELQNPVRRFNEMSVCMTEKGYLSFNGKLTKEILTEGERQLDIRFTEENKVIAIRKTDKGKIKMLFVLI